MGDRPLFWVRSVTVRDMARVWCESYSSYSCYSVHVPFVTKPNPSLLQRQYEFTLDKKSM